MPIARHDLRAAHDQLTGGACRHRLAIIIDKHDIAAGDRDADAAGPCAVIKRVETDQGRGFGQPIAFGQGRAGHRAPARRHRLVQRGAAGNGGAQFLGRIGGKPFLVHQPVEQRVDPGDPGDRVILDCALQVLHRAGRGDQDIAGPDFEKGQQIRGEGEDMIKRQRGQHAVISGHQTARDRLDLRQIGQHVAMAQHGALGHPGRATGVLQKCQILGLGPCPIGPHIRAMGTPFGKGSAQPQNRNSQLWDRRQGAAPDLLHAAHDGFGQLGEELGHPGQHHCLEIRLGNHLGQFVGEHVDDDQNLGPGIVELVDHLRRGVHRVGVDQNAARLEHTKGHHRIGQPVGQLHRHPVAGLKPAILPQIGGKGIGHRADLGIGKRAIHAVGHYTGEGPAFGMALAGLIHQVGQTFVARSGQVLWNGRPV